jgi:malate dehydrogenase (quinone)
MLSAGMQNIGLTKYLIEQVVQSPEERFAALQKYYPTAKMEDWELAIAGQRVQIIKKDKDEGGVLKFGTEIVTDASLSLAALLGASPGASTSVGIMLDVLAKCFPNEIKTDAWQKQLKAMIPSYGKSLIKDGDLLREVRAETTRVLGLETREEEWK